MSQVELPDQEPIKESGKQASSKTKVVGAMSIGFKDLLLKGEIMKCITECGFEHPSEVQQECIPQGILGMDILCQAKSGQGKTAVFVLTILQRMNNPPPLNALVLVHTRELAYQIKKEFDRFSKHFADLRTEVIQGGVPIRRHKDMLQNRPSHILVGTPGRVLALVKDKTLDLKQIEFFVLDECDKSLGSVDMRSDIQEIFVKTPQDKQVMMFSATISKDMREVCRRFMKHKMEFFIDEESKLTLHGLQQQQVQLREKDKSRKLQDLLEVLQQNQVVIFCKNVQRTIELDRLLRDNRVQSVAIHSNLNQEERIARQSAFKDYKQRLMVATDLFGRGIDIEKVNIVINYDMPDGSDPYLHRVGRAGRFGTKGLTVSFVNEEDKSEAENLDQIQKRFEVKISELPNNIDPASYMQN